MPGSPARTAPYKDFLQPVLQKRFTSTAAVLLAASYVEAIFFASWDSYFWSWFPLGPAAVRTLFIFACGLPILILRIACFHVGLRVGGSGWQTLVKLLAKPRTYETAFWYLLSSTVFCLIFLWSMPERSNFKWVVLYSGDRARLNERPLFLACYLGACAVAQTFLHFVFDIDRLEVGTCETSTEGNGAAPASQPSSNSIRSVLILFPSVFAGCAKQALSSLFMAVAVYFLILRSFVWAWALSFWRLFYNLPKSNMLPPSYPIDIYLLMRCLYAGTFLCFIWAAGNTAFSSFMAMAPLKNGKPLTSESKDPNGSLLNGLKNKKQYVKDFALWELAHVATEFDTRRQVIFQDIDRKNGPMWSQVYGICMQLIKSIEARIDETNKPAASPSPSHGADSKPRQRISAPLREDPIYSSTTHNPSKGGLEKTFGQNARSPGSSPVSKLSPLAKRTWREAKGRLLTDEQQKALTPERFRGQMEGRAASLIKVEPLRKLFQRTFRSDFAAATLGSPLAEPASYVNAVVILTQLAVHSLTEDQFGNVHRDVPSIIRTLTSVVRKLEALKKQFPIHWTDTEAVRECPETSVILDAAREGLTQLVNSFEPYANDLRLTLTDLRLAKEAAIQGPKKTSSS